MRTRKATRHLFAHFFSVFLKRKINSWRSASDFVGSHPPGAESGEIRMTIPASQKNGNTRLMVTMDSDWETELMAKIRLTETELEEVHC